jgi:hypothetical protein
MIPCCLYQNYGRSNLLLDIFLFLCRCPQETRPRTVVTYFPTTTFALLSIMQNWPLNLSLLADHLASVSAARDVLTPVGNHKLEQVNYPIYNGCPIERRGHPALIYHEQPARFKDEFRHLPNALGLSVDHADQTTKPTSGILSPLLWFVLSGYTRRSSIEKLQKRVPSSVNP